MTQSTRGQGESVNRLQRYQEMRDFGVTPEPEGATPPPSADTARFVIQEHHATALHWDFRLERDGVLASWAIPKGIPLHPRTNHLAIRTEDHPLEYADFEGPIPESQYGAGSVTIWDRGTYDTHKFREDEVMVTLHGRRVRGRYVLFRTGTRNWMIHRIDPPADPGREPMPARIEPMLARLSNTLPRDPGWTYEVKWDGVRAIAYISGGRLRLETRSGNDIAGQYPELRPLAESQGALDLILDGEIVALDAAGRPSFERLQSRIGVSAGPAARRRAAETPATYMIFDLLFLDGHATLSLPYRERRRLLEALDIKGPSWQTPRVVEDDGDVMLEATRAQGLEGVVAKRTGSPYEPGRRTGAWVKIKNHLRQRFVIGGWTQREGTPGPSVGALLLGFYEQVPDGSPQLTFAGRVGTGFTDEAAARLARDLGAVQRTASPFRPSRAIPANAFFSEPRLVADVEFLEWTADGVLRQPSFKGLRPDIDPGSVQREDPVAQVSSSTTPTGQ